MSWAPHAACYVRSSRSICIWYGLTQMIYIYIYIYIVSHTLIIKFRGIHVYIYIYIYVYNTYIYIHILNIYIYIHREREREILPASSESPSGPPAWPQRARAALRATGPPIIITITITITVTSILINTSICMIHIHNNKILATRPAGPLRRRRRCSAAGPPLHESKRHFTYGYFWITCLKTITTCSYMLHVYRSAPSAAARSPELVASPRIYTNMLYIYIYIYIYYNIYIYICIMHININIYIYIYI